MKWYLKVLNQYSDFSGRASREEYWMFALFNFIFLIVPCFLMGLFIETDFEEAAYILAILLGLYLLFIIIPSLALTVRRLHDTGRSGWFYFICIVPYVGGLILFIFTVLESEQSTNEYGEVPNGLNKPIISKSEKVEIKQSSKLIK